ncbi:MAG: ACT domain-containing protein [Actinophytocola sp.]|nr:ACT domain-containing protein [Actinophytocola sp.]
MQQRDDTTSATRGERASWPTVHAAPGTAEVTWRIRVRMADRPGTLARLAIRLADLGCNVLGLAVIPVPDGVLDEIIVRPPVGLSSADLVTAISAEGCECSTVASADVRDLADSATSTLASATRAVNEPARCADVIRDVLAADMVTVVAVSEANPSRSEGGHRAVITVGGQAIVIRRRWAPFADVELARARALLGLLTAAEANVTAPVAVTCDDGSAVVLRGGRPADSAALSALHARCSMETLFQRYHTGTRTVPRRWLHRLLLPPRGISVLGVCGKDVVALGQLIPSGVADTAEFSLLVEDSWQRNGLGTALLARLNVIGAIRGYRTIVALCLPTEDRVIRAARRAGLATTTSEENGQLRVSIATSAGLSALSPGRRTIPVGR